MYSFKYSGMNPGKGGAHGLQVGFTLVELLIALAVGLILLVIAVPEFSAIVHRNRISATGSEIYASLSLARNEAIKRRTAVQVCPSSNGTSCRVDDDWSAGWIVMIPATNQVLKTFDALETGVQVGADSQVVDFVLFNPTGDALGTVGEIRICHTGTNVRSRAVRVTAVGRIETAERTLTDCSVGV
jgi:type IV fimbrial biogenesis protein FimT